MKPAPTFTFSKPILRAVSTLLLVSVAPACDRDEEKPAPIEVATASAQLPPDPAPSAALPDELVRGGAEGDQAEPQVDASLRQHEPHDGSYLAVLSTSAGVYRNTTAKRGEKLGYARRGEHIPVKDKLEETSGCKSGWYPVVGGGYICSNDGTTKLDSPPVKLATKAPEMNEVLPYKYARNHKNGTPLYKSVPTPEQMHKYEPYLES
jgi:hypothetical protein